MGSLLLWSAVLLLLLPSLRLRPRPRLILLFSMEPMPDTHMLPDMPDTAMDTHAYGLYGKRSADAEPEADAYYYGYARPYAYGYRSYGYPAYGYGYYGKRSADAE